MFEAFEMLRSGGEWLGRARAWMQSKKHNGSRVTWGSQEELVPPVTVRELEEVAALSAQAAVNESEAGKMLGRLSELVDQKFWVPRADLSGEDHFKITQFLSRLERFRPKAK